MCASQASCRDDYECSSAGLDALCALAMDSGAQGSRLTGAGWGGCAVSLVPRAKVAAFIAALRKGYGPFAAMDDAAFATACFASNPGSGAAVFTPAQSYDV